MGLASKLQAAGVPPPGGAPAQYAPPPQQAPQQSYGAPQGPPPAYSGQSYSPAPAQGAKAQYAPPPGAPPQGGQYAPPPGPPPPVGQGGYGQQSQYGQPHQQYGQQQQQQYGATQQYGAPAVPARGPLPSTPGQGHAQGGAVSFENIMKLLQFTVQEQKIQAFYPDPRSLEALAHRIVQSGALPNIAAQWRLPMEIAVDLAKLALFDVILLIDDSGSMAFEEGGSRIDDAKLVISRVAQAASLFDDDGIQVRFLNSRIEGNGIRNEPEALALLNQIRFSGMTPLGTSLDSKILQPLVLHPARQGTLQKPVLIIAVTDGQPGGEPRDQLVRVLVNASRQLQQTRYGADALSVQLAQIGNDMHARAFLEEIDNHPVIGNLVDCTSNYELEEEEMARQGVQLTPETWLVKMLLGGIDDSYDASDEAR
ncbi:hypothetical protein JCM3770_004774 [Rhodotorula araucariae]